MKAVVIYESFWGNTAAIADAIAQGIGENAKLLTTDDSTIAELADADLIVVGAPVQAFSLPTENSRSNMGMHAQKAPEPPDLSHPPMRNWLKTLPKGQAGFAAFETRIWWSLGGATSTIERAFKNAGYRKLANRQRFIVTGSYGPLKDGELERARQWGEELAGMIMQTNADQP